MAVGAPSVDAFLVVVGTRPEALKLAPVIRELARRGHRIVLAATGQHRELLANALSDFGLVPDLDLDIMRDDQSPADVVGQLVPALTRYFVQTRPAAIIVQGDTASALAGAQAASYARLPLAHVEAGLRSGDNEPVPEEIHRRLIAQMAQLHFAPTAAAGAALRAEGIAAHSIHVTGNTGIDALRMMQARLRRDPALVATLAARFAAIDRSRPLILMTVHRRENHGRRMSSVLAAAVELAEDAEIVMPLHPSPNVRGPTESALAGRRGIHLLPPLEYPAFVWLMGLATLALTDSGGVQEEAPAIGLPVLVLRDVTERQEGIASGNAKLVGTDTRHIVAAARELLDSPAALQRMSEAAMPYGSGDASRQIADVLEARFGRALAAAE
jgi:UDP-N-acetylglucosamine 2-epimerase (non-hydrolysing)